MKAILLLLASIVGIVHSYWSLSVTSTTISSDQTLANPVTYDFVMGIQSQTITSASTFKAQFSSKFDIDASSLTNCKSSTSSAASPTTVSCSVTPNIGSGLYQVIFTGVFSTTRVYTYLRVQFAIPNPYAAGSERVDISVLDGSNNIAGFNTIFLQYEASIMTGCAVTSSSQFTVDNATHTFRMTPSRKLIEDSYLMINMPPWHQSTNSLGSSFLSCSGVSGTGSSSLTCQLDPVASGVQTLQITDGLVTVDVASPTEIVITVSNLKNPWSLQPFGPIDIDLMYSGELSQTCSPYLTVTQPRQLSQFNFISLNTEISGTSSGVRVSYFPSSTATFPRPNNRFQFDYPSSISFSYTATPYSSSSTQTVIAGISSYLISSFNVVNPPSSRPFTITMTGFYVNPSGQAYACETKSFTTNALVGVLTNVLVTPQSSQVNQINPYLIKFTIAHGLISGSFITIKFPTDLSIQTGTSTCQLTGHTCTIISANQVKVDVTATIAAQTVVQVEVNDVQNANQAKTTGTFEIKTYYDSGLDSLVDSKTSAVTVTMIAKVLDSGTVTPTSLTTYTLTTYTIDIPLDDPIPIGGSIKVVFPPSISPQDTDLVSASFPTTTCTTQQLTDNNVEIMNCFTSELTDASLSITLQNIRNPPSLKPTSSFEIYVRGSSGSTINYIISDVTVTMTTAITSTSVIITPADLIVGSSVSYTFTIQQAIDIHKANDYLVIDIPPLMTLPTVVSCTPTAGVASISCVRLTGVRLKVVYNVDPTDPTISLTLGGVVNYKVADQSVNFVFTVYNSDNFKMEQKIQPIVYEESIITSASLNRDDNVAVGEQSNITITITNSLSLYSSFDPVQTTLQITIPSDFTIGTQCTVTGGGTCSPVSLTMYRVTNVGLSMTNLNVTMKKLTLSYFDPSSQTFKVVYKYGANNVSVIDTGLVLSVFCTPPCQRCDTLASVCQSCLPLGANTFIYFDPDQQDCLTSCPDGKYPDDTNECQPCVSPCSKCLDSENCTACVANTWLYEFDCVAICPDTYYNNSNGLCSPCESPCQTCTALDSCESCSTGYYINNWCVDAEDCPAGTYANDSTMNCEDCQSPCDTCSLAFDNCTACKPAYLYYNNICDESCPDGMYPNPPYCFNCVPPCDTCLNASYCKSCATDYLSAGDCVAAEDCPVGTFPFAAEMKCKTCPTGCTSCLNSSYCTSCNTQIYLFYDFGCYTSCPPGTYKSGLTCQDCQDPCATCRTTATTCLTCVSPKVFDNSTCLDSCPDGKYDNLGICSACSTACSTCLSFSVCDSCPDSKYLDVDECVRTCPDGSFGDQASGTCLTCVPPCSQCSIEASNCTKCISPQLQFENGCVDSCSGVYFEVDGSCVTCPNCVNCLDADTCLECNPGFYQYNGVCYSRCPANAPIPDDITDSCGTCDEVCRTCIGLAKNCTSCFSGTFLHQGSCLTQCPLGFIQDLVAGTCIEPLIGNVIFFPFFFTFLFTFFVILASKCLFPPTQMITSLAATASSCEFGSWCVLTYILTVDYTLPDSLLRLCMYIGLSAIILSIGVGIAFNISVYNSYSSDKGLQTWKQFQNSHLYSYRVCVVLSSFTFRFFRFLYSILFNRSFFSLYIADGQRFLTNTNRLTFATIVINSLPMIVISAVLLYKKQIYDQTFFSALDTIVLGFICAVFLTIDCGKDKNHFETIKDGLPFLKYRNMKNDESMVSDLLSYNEEDDERKAKSEIARESDKDKVFRKITCIPNINKFGHLNVIEDLDKDQIKSLPQFNKLHQYPQFDPNHSEDRVIIDDQFLEEERRRKEEEEKLRLERQRMEREQEERKRREEEERKRRLRQEDELERVNVEFPDLAAIDKVENKNNKEGRKNPLDLLSGKKMQDRKVDDKAMKKLQEMGKKNGLDAKFMKQTFGVDKNHNPELLNSIIDKHNHVKRQSVKQLFDQNNNPQLLQQLFGKKSQMDPEKLRQLLNDPDSAILIMNLANKQNGRLSPQMAKQLLDKNSKYNKQFTKNLLSNDNGMDQEKLKTLLKDADGKGKDSPLKALKKIGGQNLENKQMLNNMLGEDAVLDPQNFTRVANDLSIQAIKNLFQNKSEHSDILTQKLLNNKKLNLKNLSPILQDEELLHELAQALGEGDPHLEENLMNLFKNAQNIDPQKLKQMLRDETIRKKLLSNPVDPTFLQALLSKDSNTDMKILSKTLKEMPIDLIQETFRFDPQKNVDFKNLATLFQANPKTDPKLVSKMLEPDMVKQLYYKGSDPKMLNKLVEKGNQFDPEVIKGVYGKQKNHFLDTQTDKMINLQEQNEKREEFRSQRDFSLGFQQNRNVGNNLANMSRTTAGGGMMSFLNPIVHKNKAKVNNMSKNLQDDDGWSSRNDDDDDGEIPQDEQIVDGKRRKKIKSKKMKKKVGDIRHPAEQIYLQRIQAPHEHAVKKASIRKKKKKMNNPGVMDEDNDIFDMDF